VGKFKRKRVGQRESIKKIQGLQNVLQQKQFIACLKNSYLLFCIVGCLKGHLQVLKVSNSSIVELKWQKQRV
jgi:hypothetical protein